MANYTAGEQVSNILREKILSGEIPDNTELTQTWIADQLGVSRMPIREALSKLEFEGFIERLDNRHTRIIGIEGSLLKSRLCLLTSLESDAAIALAECQDMQSRMSQLEKCSEADPCFTNEILFHKTLFKAADDRFFYQMYQNIVKPSLEILIRRTVSDESYPLLKDIIRTIKSTDCYEIRSVVESYYKILKKNMRKAHD